MSLWRRWKYGVLSFKGVAELSNKEWFEQLPFIVAISVMAGVMGALFNIAHKRMFRVRTHTLLSFKESPQAHRFATCACRSVCLVTACDRSCKETTRAAQGREGTGRWLDIRVWALADWQHGWKPLLCP